MALGWLIDLFAAIGMGALATYLMPADSNRTLMAIAAFVVFTFALRAARAIRGMDR